MPEQDAETRPAKAPAGPRLGKAPPAPRQRKAPPSPLSVITAALGLFFVVLTLLAIQVRNGRDPALGPGPAVPALTQPGAKGTAGGQAATAQATGIVTRTSPAPPP